jgi:putative ABC transport system permease protein
VIRHAWRTLVRMPVVSAVIVLSLAAGIGVNTVVFSWIQARMLKPMPAVEDGARFFGIEAKTAGMYPGSSWLEYQDLNAGLRSFDAVIASRMAPMYAGDPGEVQRAYGVLASGNYFEALGVRPAAGRFFRADEVAARAPVAVI